MISVIVVTKGDRLSLANCLDSLQKQSYNDYEIVIVYPNFNSQFIDKDVDINKSYFTDQIKVESVKVKPIRVIQSGQGIGNARNCGIAIAKGEIIAFTDDDCVVPNDWLQKIADKFNENPSYSYIGGEFTIPKTKDIWLQWIDKRYHLSQSNINAGLAHGNNMAFRREVFDKFKFDDTVAFGFNEADLELRLHASGEKSNVFKDILVEHRHEGGFEAFNKMRLGYVKGRVHIYRKQGRELFTLLDIINFCFVLSLFYSVLTFNPILLAITAVLSTRIIGESLGVLSGWKIAIIDIYSNFLWSFGKLYYSLGAKL